jgi:hypothetical protein
MFRGNLGPHRPDDTLPESDVVDPLWRDVLVGTPFPAPSVTTTSEVQAYADVLGCAGAIEPSRDSVDSRVVTEVQNGTGQFINNPPKWGVGQPWTVGRLPQTLIAMGCLTATRALTALILRWTIRPGDANGDGYTNIEEYINSLIGC